MALQNLLHHGIHGVGAGHAAGKHLRLHAAGVVWDVAEAQGQLDAKVLVTL